MAKPPQDESEGKTSQPTDTPSWDELRRRAEQQLKGSEPRTSVEALHGDGAGDASEDPRRVAQELRLHQMELELQNEDLRSTKEELQFTLDRYRSLFELAPIGYVSLDLAGGIREANDMAKRLLGQPESALLGRSLWTLVDEGDIAVVHQHVLDTLSSRVRQRCEVCTPDGQWIRIESIALSGQSPHRPAGCRTALIDVQERVRAEAQERDGEAQLQAVLDTAVEGILTFDGRGTLGTYNRAAERMFGRRLSEVPAQNVRSIIPDIDQVMRAAGPEAAIRAEASGQGGGGIRRELSGVRRDGTQFPLELSVGEVEDGEPRFTVVLRDITEQRQLESEMRHAQKMEAVGRLASGIAHDFNNLLTGLNGAVDMGLAHAEHDSTMRRVLETIKTGVLSGSGLVSQLVAFSRTEGSETLPAEVDALLLRLEPMLRSLVGEGIELDVQLGAPGAHVQTAAGQLDQVLVNLAINARDAMPEGGMLRIETGTSSGGTDAGHGGAGQADGGAAEPRVVLSVTDNGQGMDEATQQSMFEPFFTTKGEQGTGLGLSTVYGIVHGLGGTITVQSELGQGTRFALHLPRCEPRNEERPEEPAQAHGPDGQGETVLVVEDDRLTRAAVRHTLERRGYHVLEAPDRAHALEVLESSDRAVHAVLSDVVLSGGTTGMQMADDVRRLRPEAAVQYMSALPRHVLAERVALPTEVTPLQKPFTERDLLQAIRGALDSHTPGSQPPATRRDQEQCGVLLVEDHAASREATRELLEESGYQVFDVGSGAEAESMVARYPGQTSVAVVDFQLPDVAGDELVDALRTRVPELAAIYISGYEPDDSEALRRALQQPRTKYVGKPLSLGELTGGIEDLVWQAQGRDRTDPRSD